MQYSLHINIEKPLEEVVALFGNPDNLKMWQPGLTKREHISGIPGEEGAKTKLYFDLGKRKMEMVETITKRSLPHAFHGTYETKGVLNIQENYFEAIDAQTTRWRSDSEFRFEGFMMKLMGMLMPGAFKKQSQKYMELFKAFAETGESQTD